MKKIIALGLLLLLVGCDRFPKDPEHTLEEVTNGTLIIGYSSNPPWVVKHTGEPGGIEAEILTEYANTLSADVEWVNDTEQNLYEKLEKKEVHLVIAGITNDNPWIKRVAFTRPYLQLNKKKHVIAAARGENAFIMDLEKFLYSKESQIKKELIR